MARPSLRSQAGVLAPVLTQQSQDPSKNAEDGRNLQSCFHVARPHAVVDSPFTVTHKDVQCGHLIFVLVIHELEVDFVVT